MYHETELAKDRLASDFKAIVADAEELLHVTADQNMPGVAIRRTCAMLNSG